MESFTFTQGWKVKKKNKEIKLINGSEGRGAETGSVPSQKAEIMLKLQNSRTTDSCRDQNTLLQRTQEAELKQFKRKREKINKVATKGLVQMMRQAMAESKSVVQQRKTNLRCGTEGNP